jgi:hypothetical protein
MWWSAIDTESVSDSGSSITVLVVSLSLVALGVALLGVTVWFWKLTRPDPDALGPLVVMSEPDFFRRGPIDQRRSLDEARPGAVAIEAPISTAEDEVPTESEGDVELDQESENEIEASEAVHDIEDFDDVDVFDEEVFDDAEGEDGEVFEHEVVDIELDEPADAPTADDDDPRQAPIDPLL